MFKLKRINLRSLVVTLNILVLLIIIIFYLSRMVYFYKKENDVVKNTGNVTFHSILVNKQSLVDFSKGLIFDEKNNSYVFKGLVEDNYIKYSGILFRIMGIDSSGNLKLVSDDSLTIMYSGLNKGFESSFINSWLNTNEEVENSGYFERNFNDKNSYIVNTNTCNDVISDLTNVTCDEQTYDDGFSIMSLYDYINAGAKESYLNNGKDFYLRTLNDKNNNYYVASTGEIGTDTTTTKVRGVRVVFSIKSNIKLLSGNGTINNPYVVEENNPKVLTDLNIADTLLYSNMNWKVVERNEENIKVVLVDKIKTDEEYKIIKFGGNNSVYVVDNNIGKYLNNEFYNSLENKEYIVDGKWFTGSNSLSNLDYKAKYTSSVDAKVGILGFSDLFVNELSNIFTLTRGIEASNLIMVINKDGHAYADYISKEYNIRPSIYLNGKLEIESGKGYANNPYKIKEIIDNDNSKEE